MTSSQEVGDAFKRDGFVLVPDVFDPSAMQAALAETERIFYGCPYTDFLYEQDKSGKSSQPAPGRIQFPCGVLALDRLLEDEQYLDLFAECLGTAEMSYANGHLFVRCGAGDQPHPQWHIDHGTNSFLPPSPEIGSYEYVNSWVFLHDVGVDGAPLQVIPGSHRVLPEILPRLLEQQMFRPPHDLSDVSQVPEFAAPVAVTARAGSALFYSSYLVHSAVGFEDPRAQRAVWAISLARADNRNWTKFSNVWTYGERGYSAAFFTDTTPRVRSLFGWPVPGHPYYTPQTLQLLSYYFPGIDLRPYRNALSK